MRSSTLTMRSRALICSIFVGIAAAAVDERMLASKQGNAACFNCRGGIYDLLTSTPLDVNALGIQHQITLSWWDRTYDNTEPEGWGPVGLFLYGDQNFFQPWKSALRIDYYAGKSMDPDEQYWSWPLHGRWHHKAVAVNSANGNVVYYRDGQVVANSTGIHTGFDFSSSEGLLLSLGNYNDGYQDRTLSEIKFNGISYWAGAVDEVRLYNRQVSPQEMKDIGSVDAGFGVSAATTTDPSLVLHYTFDDSSNDPSDPRSFKAENHGSGGNMYDLIPSFGNENFRGILSGVECTPATDVHPPLIMKMGDTGIAPNASSLRAFGVEDTVIGLRLYRNIEDFGGSMNMFTITQLPAKGKLYTTHIDCADDSKVPPCSEYKATRREEVTVAPFKISDVSAIPGRLEYIPQKDGSGFSFDSFKYKVTNDEGLDSTEGIVTFDIDVLDDTAQSLPVPTAMLNEDPNSGHVEIVLNASDVEGDVVALFITKMPSKGSLYLPPLQSGGALGPRIDSVYEKSLMLNYLEQYAFNVISVSSFWGGPPYAGYHAMNVLGKPSCVAPGSALNPECKFDERSLFTKRDDGSWAEPLSESDIGELVLVHRPGGYGKAPARIVSVDPERNKVNVSVTVMLKKGPQGKPVYCIIGDEKGSHPDDCDPDLVKGLPVDNDGVPFDIHSFNRSDLQGVTSGVWCPLKKGYTPGTLMTGETAYAYGAQYAFNHTQDAFYNNPLVHPRYTEYIEVEFKVPVYPTGVVIGCTRGCHDVVSIKARNGDLWESVYAGKTDPAKDKERKNKMQYLHFNPVTCHMPFKTNALRIEIDTTTETGS